MAKKTSPASAFSHQSPSYNYSNFKVPSSMLSDSNSPVLSESAKGTTSNPAASTSDSATSASSAN